MTTTKTEIHPGDRYIDRDWRNPGRVVEVQDVQRYGKWQVKCVENPNTPEAVGRRVFVSENTLRTKYRLEVAR